MIPSRGPVKVASKRALRRQKKNHELPKKLLWKGAYVKENKARGKK